MAVDASVTLRPVRSAATVISGVTARKAIRSGAVWGAVFGVYLAAQALTYASTYKTAAARHLLVVQFGSNSGVAAIAGPARDISSVAGFTAWKCLLVLAVVGAVWGLLLSTRLLRGEEDAGRWELLLIGQTTRRRGAVQAIGGLAAGLAVLWAVTALLTVLVGRSSKVQISAPGALYLALAVASGAAMFLALGALTSQLAPTRRQAAGYAAAVLGVSYGVRMVADSSAGVAWLRWASPLGWIEELQPLTSPRPVALLPISAWTVIALGLAVHLAGQRDLGASTIPDRSTAPARTRLLSGPLGLTVRLNRAALLAWAVAIGLTGLLLGSVAKSAGAALNSSPTIRRALARIGASGNGATEYLGVAFLIAAVLVACAAAGQISAARAEEADGRLDPLLVRVVSRRSWLGGRLLVAAIAVVATGVLAGLLAWVGAAAQGTGIGLARCSKLASTSPRRAWSSWASAPSPSASGQGRRRWPPTGT